MRKVLESSGQIMPGFPIIPVFEVHCGELVAILKQSRPQYSPVFFGKEGVSELWRFKNGPHLLQGGERRKEACGMDWIAYQSLGQKSDAAFLRMQDMTRPAANLETSVPSGSFSTILRYMTEQVEI
jgi:hypothetical protein